MSWGPRSAAGGPPVAFPVRSNRIAASRPLCPNPPSTAPASAADALERHWGRCARVSPPSHAEGGSGSPLDPVAEGGTAGDLRAQRTTGKVLTSVLSGEPPGDSGWLPEERRARNPTTPHLHRSAPDRFFRGPPRGPPKWRWGSREIRVWRLSMAWRHRLSLPELLDRDWRRYSHQTCKLLAISSNISSSRSRTSVSE
jgi:hypothetical protein